MPTVYRLNKGINRPIEFKGLKGQYITLLAAGLVALLLSFAFLYLLGVDLSLCLALVLGAGTCHFLLAFRLSRRFGRHGLMKKWASTRLPPYIRLSSRRVFLHLKE